MPTPFAKVSLPVLVLGGAAAGAFVGFQFFGDDQLRRLSVSHEIDRIARVDAQKYVPNDRL